MMDGNETDNKKERRDFCFRLFSNANPHKNLNGKKKVVANHQTNHYNENRDGFHMVTFIGSFRIIVPTGYLAGCAYPWSFVFRSVRCKRGNRSLSATVNIERDIKKTRRKFKRPSFFLIAAFSMQFYHWRSFSFFSHQLALGFAAEGHIINLVREEGPRENLSVSVVAKKLDRQRRRKGSRLDFGRGRRAWASASIWGKVIGKDADTFCR